MNTWIILFRGINVGGNNILRMKDLTALLANLGFADVDTYIQSGNVILRSAEVDSQKLGIAVATAIENHHGFRPHLMPLTLDQFERTVADNPFPDAVSAPKSLHFYFLAEPAENPDIETMDEIRSTIERFALTDQVLYLHAPDGIGRSKLAGRIERCLGVNVTARNWRTVSKTLEIARQHSLGKPQ